jgi:hypothetical protein
MDKGACPPVEWGAAPRARVETKCVILDTSGMSRHQPEFKSTQIFDWASEPSDERPTDFGRSTGFSTLNGYLVEPPSRAMARRRRDYRAGVAKLLVASAVILGISIVAMYEMARYLRMP